MCITAILAAASLVTGAIGAKASISAANNNMRAEIWKANLEQQQASDQRKQLEIQAMQQENERSREFERSRSSALAAIGASGLGEHISFFNGIDPAGQENFLRDVRAIRLNMTAEKKTLADQISVADYSKVIARSNAKASKLSALADFAGAAMNAFNFYNMYKIPGPAKTKVG